MLVDAHTHALSHDLGAYPRAATTLTSAPSDDAVDADGLLSRCEAAGVGAAVLVQWSGAYGSDCRYLADAVDAHRDRLSGVCTVEMDPSVTSADEAVAALRHWIVGRRLHGVRVFALDLAGGPGWIADPATFPVWEEAASLAVPVVVTVLAHQLPGLADVLGAFPHVPVALDHCGFPDLTGPPPWADVEALCGLARRANLHLKVSSHVLHVLDGVPDGPATLVARLARSFGSDRLAWGSDFCQTHDRPYTDLVALAERSASRLSPTGRERYLGRTASGLWRRPVA